MLVTVIASLSLGSGLPAVDVPVRSTERHEHPQYDFSTAREALARPEVDAPGVPVLRDAGPGERLQGPAIFAGGLPSEAAARPGELRPASRRWLDAPRLRFSERRRDLPLVFDAPGSGPLASALGLSALCVTAVASTLPTEYIVDEDGGPGVDFLEIRDALDVALDGDLVTVREGYYEPFTLSRAVSIIGTHEGDGVRVGLSVNGVFTNCRVEKVAGIAVIADIRFFRLRVEDNPGTVVLDGVITYSNPGSSSLLIRNSPDVRVHRSTLEVGDGYQVGGQPAVAVIDSRAELSGCELVSGRGTEAECYYGYLSRDSTPAVDARAGSLVHVTRSDASTGDGGPASCWCEDPFDWEDASDGGPGLLASEGYMIVNGDGHTVQGGGPGWEFDCPPSYAGQEGPGVRIEAGGAMRISGMVVQSGGPGAPAFDNQGGLLVQPAVADPTLELLGDPAPGAPLQFVVRGQPGGRTRIWFSRIPIVEQTTGAWIDRLIPYEHGVLFVEMPPSGEAVFDWIVPRALPTGGGATLPAWLTPLAGPPRGPYRRGTVLFAQATVFTDGQSRRTNSVPVVIH